MQKTLQLQITFHKEFKTNDIRYILPHHDYRLGHLGNIIIGLYYFVFTTLTSLIML